MTTAPVPGAQATMDRMARDCAAKERGPALRDALKKCVTGEPSKPYEDLESAVTRLRMINAVVAEALKGLP